FRHYTNSLIAYPIQRNLSCHQQFPSAKVTLEKTTGVPLRTLALLTLSLALLPSLLIAKGKPKRQTVTAPDAARHGSNEDNLRSYFSTPLLRAFEVHRGKQVRTGRYAFPVVLLETTDPSRAKRRYSEIIVMNTGSNDWAVDKLP